MDESLSKRNARLLRRLVLVAVGMFGFGFALVPLYDVFCDITGLNGKVGRNGPAQVTNTGVDNERWVRVQFLTHNNGSMPWEFYPLTREVRVHPGQPVKVEFVARNPAGRTMTGQAVPSVAPSVGAGYFHKTECFCFEQQILEPGQEVRMPVVFVVDTALPAGIGTLTLSYTLFDVTESTTKTRS